jgi:hypothetical protein
VEVQVVQPSDHPRKRKPRLHSYTVDLSLPTLLFFVCLFLYRLYITPTYSLTLTDLFVSGELTSRDLSEMEIQGNPPELNGRRATIEQCFFFFGATAVDSNYRNKNRTRCKISRLPNYVLAVAATPLLLLATPPPPPRTATVTIFGFSFLLRTNHLTRSRAATESSTDECPCEPPPSWIDLLRNSFVLSWWVHESYNPFSFVENGEAGGGGATLTSHAMPGGTEGRGDGGRARQCRRRAGGRGVMRAGHCRARARSRWCPRR